MRSGKSILAMALLAFCSLAHAEGEGSGHSGGGQAKSAKPLTRDMLRAEITHSLKTNLTWVLNEWELARGKPTLYLSGKQFPAENRDAIFELLFGPRVSGKLESKSVFDQLSALKFVPRESGACKDRLGQDQDASSFNPDPAEICFSLERLLPKLRGPVWKTELVALAAHEVSHRVGTSEKEAKAIQNYLRQVLREDGPAYAKAFVAKDLRDQLTSISYFLERSIGLAGTADAAKTPSLLCDEMSMMAVPIYQIGTDLEQFAVWVASPLRYIDNGRVDLFMETLGTAIEYCGLQFQNKPSRNETNMPIFHVAPSDPLENSIAELDFFVEDTSDLAFLLPESTREFLMKSVDAITVEYLRKVMVEAQKLVQLSMEAVDRSR